MYNSLRKFCNTPLIYKPHNGYAGNGDKLYGDLISTDYCMIVENAEEVKLTNGDLYISETQLYADSSCKAKIGDSCCINTPQDIMHVSSYKSFNSADDIKVFYL